MLNLSDFLYYICYCILCIPSFMQRKEMWLQRRVGGGGEVCTEGSSSLTSIIQRPPPAPPRLAVWVPLSRKADCKMLQIRLERIAEEVSVQGPVTTTYRYMQLPTPPKYFRTILFILGVVSIPVAVFAL